MEAFAVWLPHPISSKVSFYSCSYQLGKVPHISIPATVNNIAENAIRPFVVGRKNWLFSGSPDGARASATFFTLIESAKANGLEPYTYLRNIFEKLPLAQTEQDLKELMPQNIDPDSITISRVIADSAR